MKTKILAIAFAIMSMFVLTPTFNDVQAQGRTTETSTVGQLLAGLVNVAIGNVDIDISDVQVVNIEDSEILTDFEINILNNVLNNSPILSNWQDVLNDLLRDADIITDNQVVVGILGGVVYVLEL